MVSLNSLLIICFLSDPVDAIRLIPDVREWRLVRGTKKTFRCVALGNPDPTIIWEFFPQASQTSRISWGRTIKLDPDTSGVYVCTANNTVGGISYKLTKTLTVTVYPVDAIRLIPDVREWRLVRGTKKTFDCVTLGNPEPTIMWEFFPQASQTSKISWGRSIELDPDTSGVYVCTANNTVGGISNKLTKTLTVTVYVPPTPVPPSTKEPSTKPVSTTKKSGAPPAPSTDKNKIIIGSIIPILIIIIIVIIVIILYKRRAKPAEIEEPPEKPRNNHSEVNMMNTKPDLVHSTGIEKKVPMYNNGFDHGGEDDLSSMEVTFDDKPRSRKPVIPLSSPDTYNTTLPCV
ncbi:fibroblast growth factor receptor-like 1 isoform X1 [Octopus bimaculoides]|uniref:fibroblast growth factor receptor-like 1 isoform X1 n=1 Tax=Octopus bimaculoides TaxID=37653 RepID=UPI00071D03DA|nr:fibroblast growth factor receptor-like 1 isoform X1 [Octopus bimaculoides]|eukprot:XP_014771957.1 PREDICTED: fibroblast growth factor receptor-like 1 isoform X1 [Octopus bimaculoides]